MTPDGLVVSRWNCETQETDSGLMEENDLKVLSSLRTFCEIDPDTTLWHIMNFVRKNDALSQFLSQYSWCNSIDAFHAELDHPAVIDENDGMDHMEVRWAVDYHKTNSHTSFDLSPDFVGVGLPITKETQQRRQDDPRGELPIGFIETYSVSASPVNQFAHLKVVLNTEVVICRVKRHPKVENCRLLSSECGFSLLDILDAIYWDISFHGPPTQRDEFLGEMKERMDDIETGLVDTRPIDDLLDDMGVPPRTEEDNKAEDEIDGHEWDIEED